MIPLHDNQPTRRFPVLTVALIVINLVVFVAGELNAPTQLLHTNRGPARVDGMSAVTAEYGFVPCELVSRCDHGPDRVDFGGNIIVHVHHVPVLETVLTGMFLHGGWMHVLGNMLFLWIFGNNVEDRIGRLGFLPFYLLGGLVAAGLQLLSDPSSAVPTIGASGAIAAVLGAYLVLYPRAFVVTYIPPFFFLPLPAILFLIVWFGFQLLDASSAHVGSGGGVAYFAHIGGFVFGALTIRRWVRPPRAPAAATS